MALLFPAILGHEEPSNDSTYTYHQNCHFHDFLLKENEMFKNLTSLMIIYRIERFHFRSENPDTSHYQRVQFAEKFITSAID